MAAHVRARTGLVEIQGRRRCLDVAERGVLEIERRIANAAPLERIEERLLPLRVLVDHDEVGFHSIRAMREDFIVM